MKITSGAQLFELPDVTEPQYACKNGVWRPALAHPAVEIKTEFLKQHPHFKDQVAMYKVKIEDVTD